MVDFVTPNIGGPVGSPNTFASGFTKLCVVSITGNTTVTIGTQSIVLPVGLPVFFEAPNGKPHTEVVVSTTGTYLYQEYR
jgi:hypothetical protein